MYIAFLLSYICLFTGSRSSSLFSRCKVSDLRCIENSINAALPPLLDGIPELGIEKSDPQFNEIIEAHLPMLNLMLFNTSIDGYKDCTISKLRLNQNITRLQCDLYCPPLEANGLYNISGYIMSLPLVGSGDFTFISGKYLVNLDSELEKIQGSDGKIHVKIKTFKFIANPLTPITYNFRNLFNGREDLAEPVHKIVRENWRAVAALAQDPIWYISLLKLIKNINKYLEYVALEDIIIIS